MDDWRGLKENKISAGRFQKLKLKLLKGEKYTGREKEIIKSIREKFTINENTLLRKIIKPEDAEKYVSGDYNAIMGYISRAEDYNDVGNFKDIFETFRLNYKGTPYHLTDKSYWKIEFKTTSGNLEKINLDNTYEKEFGGGNVDENPCTRNGFTGSENGKVIPEWNLKKDGVGYDDNALMTKIENGKIVEQYRYVQKENLWRKIK